MRHYGLIGSKLGHSFSKKYFSEKFKHEGIDAIYSLYELDEIKQLKSLIYSDNNLCGINVTIPYKQSVIPYLDELSEDARAIGAVNCITIQDGILCGYNTDIEGIAVTLDRLCIEPCSRALVLGTGGASKAVCYVLRRRNIEFTLVSRSADKGDIVYDRLTDNIIASHNLIINTTPLGMYPDVESAPELNYNAISDQHKVFDLVYNPSPTKFMAMCSKHGATVMGGELMLEIQAEASWRVWNR